MAVSSTVFSQAHGEKSGQIPLEELHDQFFIVDYLCSDSLRHIRADSQLALIVLRMSATFACNNLWPAIYIFRWHIYPP